MYLYIYDYVSKREVQQRWTLNPHEKSEPVARGPITTLQKENTPSLLRTAGGEDDAYFRGVTTYSAGLSLSIDRFISIYRSIDLCTTNICSYTYIYIHVYIYIDLFIYISIYIYVCM